MPTKPCKSGVFLLRLPVGYWAGVRGEEQIIVAKKPVNKRTKPKVYLETTFVSYLTAWPSRDLVIAAHQQITRDWWEAHQLPA